MNKYNHNTYQIFKLVGFFSGHALIAGTTLNNNQVLRNINSQAKLLTSSSNQ